MLSCIPLTIMIPLCPVMSWLFICSPGKFMILLKDNCVGQPLIGKYDIFFVSVAEKLKCTSVYCANKVTISAYCIHVVTMSVLQVV